MALNRLKNCCVDRIYMSQNLLLEDLIQKALSKINGKKEGDLCRFLPCSSGYMHHFTFRSEVCVEKVGQAGLEPATSGL